MSTSAKAPAKTTARAARPAVRTRRPRASAAAAPSDAQEAQEAPKAKAAKRKLVRDSFAMPTDEHAAIAQIKKRALQGAHAAKKSEILRAGLRLLAALSDAELLSQLRAVPPLKTGRPKSRK
jgi:hypothetical protein